ncbi:ABC transporter ATP-binding protein [Streptomyces sp. NPDC059063]|uniref:ABC transporter ATP-binding protein n=1 Tax=unclassified Streptomyces TaxID=2593676 RepID=UPI0036B33A6D
MPRRRLLGVLRPHPARVTLLVVLIVALAATTVAPAVAAQRLIDDGVLRRDEGTVWTMTGALVALGVAQAVLTYLERRFATRLAEDVVLRLRTDVFTHLQRQSLGFFSVARTGALVSRLHGDVAGVQQVIAGTLPAAVSALFLLLTTGLAVIAMEWRLAALVLLLIPALYLLTAHFTVALRKVNQRQLAAFADLDSLVAERLSSGGAEVIRHYGHPDRDTPEFQRLAAAIRDTSVRRASLAAALTGSLVLMVSLVTALVYLVASRFAIAGSLSLGTVIALLSLMARLFGPLTALPGLRVELVAGRVAFDRVQEVLEFEPQVVDAPDARPLPIREDRPPSVEFRGVDFVYPPPHDLAVPSLAGDDPFTDELDRLLDKELLDKELLDGSLPDDALPEHDTGPRAALAALSFTAAPGTTVGIVGLSGAGKSTLTRLLTRSFDVDSGHVLIDGVDVRKLRLDDVRAAVGVVPQETFLFNDTIRANLLIARPQATTEELAAACRDARVWPAVEQLPDGLDTVIGDRGLRLSGGERQRLALARLLLKRPPIVVLDEATSHSDTVTEQELQESMGAFLRTRTCLVIAHRLSTVRDADQILVVRDGRVVERGRHQELLNTDGWYARLHRAQNGVPTHQSA